MDGRLENLERSVLVTESRIDSFSVELKKMARSASTKLSAEKKSAP